MLKDMNDTDFQEKVVKEDLTIINYSASWCVVLVSNNCRL